MPDVTIIILIVIIIYLRRKVVRTSNNYKKQIHKEENINRVDNRSWEEKEDGKRRRASLYDLKLNFWDSKSEEIIFNKINSLLSDKYILIPHLGLRELFKAKEKYDNADNFKYLCLFHFDVVIFSKYYMIPLLVIEFDGKNHEDERQILNDIFKDTLLENSNIPILRINNTNICDLELHNMIEEKFSEYKICQKCGSKMIMKNGVNGLFYGCTGYDEYNCKYSVNRDGKWF
jgi:topoisomerase DNA-binding C4 zinc finger domain protein